MTIPERGTRVPVLSVALALLALAVGAPLSGSLVAQAPDDAASAADGVPSPATSPEPAVEEADPAAGADASSELSRWSLDLWLAAPSPKGDLAKLNRGGVMGWGSLGVRWTPRLRVRGDAGFARLQRGGLEGRFEEGSRGPQTDLWVLLVGPEVELTPPGEGPWRVTASVSGGATLQDVGEPRGVPLDENRSPVRALVGTGAADVSVGYDVARTVRLFLRGGGFIMFGDSDDPDSSFLGKEAVLFHAGGIRLQF